MEKVMPQTTAAEVTAASASGTSVRTGDRDAFSRLVDKSRTKVQARTQSKSQAKDVQKNGAGDGKVSKKNAKSGAGKVRDAGKDEGDDQKDVAKSDDVSLTAVQEDVALATVTVQETQPEQIVTDAEGTKDVTEDAVSAVQETVQTAQPEEAAQAVDETAVQPETKNRETTQADAKVQEVQLETDQTQQQAQVQDETQAVRQPVQSQAAAQTQAATQVQAQSQAAAQTQAATQVQAQSQSQTQQVASSHQEQTVSVEKVSVTQDVTAQAADVKVDLNELSTLSGQAQAVQGATADVKAAFSAKVNAATTRAAEKLARPIVEKVSTQASTNGGMRTITLQLTPAKLGTVRVVMQVSDQGVSLRFSVQTDQAKQMLQSVSGKLEQILKNAETSSTQRATQSFDFQKADRTETVSRTPQYEQDASSLMNSNQGGSRQFEQGGMRQTRTVNGYRKAPVLEERHDEENETQQVPTSTISILA